LVRISRTDEVVHTGRPPRGFQSEAVKRLVACRTEMPSFRTQPKVLTLEEMVRDARAPMAFSMSLLLVASALAVLLGAVGE
jgi:hypothetical protein